MLIGELVNRTGMSKDTIRFYEKHGLISVRSNERRDNNYKEYSDEVLNKVLNIKHLKGFGFTLNECAEMLEMIEANEATCKNIETKIHEKILLLQQKIEEMEQVKSTLMNKIVSCGTQCTPTDKEVNCPIVVSEKR